MRRLLIAVFALTIYAMMGHGLADSLDADALYNRAMSLHTTPIYNNHSKYLETHQEAISCMERAIELNHTNPKYWEGLGILSSVVDDTTHDADYTKALSAFDKAIQLWTDSESKAHDLTGKAFLLIQIGIRENQSSRFYDAIEACDEALRIFPEDECAPGFKKDALTELNTRNLATPYST
jgi:tetratricopeptide (TPR) repeat protein